MNIFELQYAGIPIMALIVGLVQLLKISGLNKKYAAWSSVILGITSGITLFSNGDIKTGIVVGLGLGLGAVGLYSTGKNTIEDVKKE